ncbi:MAG TPA: hypothetical protein PKX15_00085 [Bacteroidales bacterium]|jgi:predicted histone-like DNA-binding protein|nr:hypothetical protein [Bacteroidales bacterium]
MSILYKPEGFSQPGVAGGGILQYRAAIVHRGTIDMDRIIQDIELTTTVSGTDVKAVVSALRERMEYYLSYGYRIVIINLGTFTPFIQSYVCKSIDEVDVNAIRRVSVGYRPCSNLQHVLFNATFERARKQYW